jgi:hypothetical protein
LAYIEISGETLSLVLSADVVLAACYCALCEWLDGLCLCEGCGDGFVDDEGGDEVAQDGVALALGPGHQPAEVVVQRHPDPPSKLTANYRWLALSSPPSSWGIVVVRISKFRNSKTRAKISREKFSAKPVN